MDSSKQKSTPSKSQLMYDPMIIPRVKQYLEENVHQRYLDVGVMARMLQERYREYSRRKAAPFRQLVEQAYKTVLHSYGLDSNPSSDGDDDLGSDLEVMEETAPPARPDPMNSMLTSMYMGDKAAPATPAKAAGGAAAASAPLPPPDSNELIDISSDEEDGGVGEAGKKAAPAAAASPSASAVSAASKAQPSAGGVAPVTRQQSNALITVVPAGGAGDAATEAAAGAAQPSAKKRKIHNATEHAIAAAEHLNTLLQAGNSVGGQQQQGQLPSSQTDLYNVTGSKNHVTSPGGKQPGHNQGNNQRRALLPTPQQQQQQQQLATLNEVATLNGGGSGGSHKAASNTGGPSGGRGRSAAVAAKRQFAVTTSELTFDKVGGLDAILKQLCELLLHIKHPEVYWHIGLPPPRGFLLHGPPGCGKTMLAQAIAGQLDIQLIQVAATELIGGVSGESEERIRELFEQAAAIAPCVLFIDEIDAISANRQNAQKDMERRIVAQLLASLDGLSRHARGAQVLVIGATNRADTLDPALRRVGRFDQEISLGIPDRRSREHILRVICAELRLTLPFDYDWIAALTPGYVGADLLALATRAASIAVKRAFTAKADSRLRHKRALHEADERVAARAAEKLAAAAAAVEAKRAAEEAAIVAAQEAAAVDDSSAVVELLDDIVMEEEAVAKTTEVTEVAEEEKVDEVEAAAESVVVAEPEQAVTPTPDVVVEPLAEAEPIAVDEAAPVVEPIANGASDSDANVESTEAQAPTPPESAETIKDSTVVADDEVVVIAGDAATDEAKEPAAADAAVAADGVAVDEAMETAETDKSEEKPAEVAVDEAMETDETAAPETVKPTDAVDAGTNADVDATTNSAAVDEPNAEKTDDDAVVVAAETTDAPAEDTTAEVIEAEVVTETPTVVEDVAPAATESTDEVVESTLTPAAAVAEVVETVTEIVVDPTPDEIAATQSSAPATAPPTTTTTIDETIDLSDDEEDEIITPETFSQALLRNPTVRLSLSLDEMLGWLSSAEPVVSADEIRDLSITMADFCAAVKVVQPSAKREGFITVPDVTWADIGALRQIREELQLAVLAPVRFPQKLEALGLKSPSGVLLCGPPGCGKTLLAKAVANEAGINFISVKGPELLNMYVGESERAVRQCFQRARNSAPCVIFFDEFDALCPTRSGSSENTSSSRVVNQLLTEMDGVEERKGVFLMAATNRPDIVDPAVMRPGRLDKILYVGLPSEEERAEILEALTKTKPKLASDVSHAELAKLTENFTGADLAGLVRQAALQALKDSIAEALAAPAKPNEDSANGSGDGVTEEPAICVQRSNFLRALTQIRPSVSEEDKRHYLRLQKKYTVMSADDGAAN